MISVAGHRLIAAMACADVDVFAVSVQEEVVLPIDDRDPSDTLLAKDEDCSKSDVLFSISSLFSLT